MGQVLQLKREPSGASRTTVSSETHPRRSADIILFPGVRYERMPGHVARPPGRDKRDWLELPRI